jgi:predicted phosphodiesterase
MMAKVLVVGDIHAPVVHPGYMNFCVDIYEEWDCNQVLFVGDVIDHHAISFHARNPNCPGPTDEYALAKQQIQKWYATFPKARVCIGNHDDRVIRLAESVHIPEVFLRDYKEVWGTPRWDWDHEHTIDDTYYFHGVGHSGIHPAWNAAAKMLMPVVMGHCHARAGIKWRANPKKRIFSVDVGCGIDIDAYQFAYSKHVKERPILSAAVILDGIPYHEVMPCGRKEKYHKSRFRETP